MKRQRKRITRLLMLALVAGLASAAVTAQETNPYVLTTEEEAAATQLAHGELQARGYQLQRPLYATEAEIVRIKPTEEGGDPGGRLALITHYRYEGNLTIQTFVDLEAGTVIEVQDFPDLPTRLSTAELELASSLALADSEVVAALGANAGQVEIEGAALRGAGPNDFERIFRLFFKIGSAYLAEPIAFVNLTTLEVWTEAAQTPLAKKKPGASKPTTPKEKTR